MLFMQLAGRKDDPLNMVHMELLIRSPLLPGSESVLGKATLHIHDIIHVSFAAQPLSAHNKVNKSGILIHE